MTRSASSSYDEVAVMYHTLWADWYLPAALPALQRLFFDRVPRRSPVLDVCCGSGHVTKELVARGYTVTGVDNSAELIELARRSVSGADFQVQDARALRFEQSYAAALSTFDSLNHLLDKADLESAFRSVFRSLGPGGLFLFDMNLEEAYTADLREWAVDLRDTSVGLVRGRFDFNSKRASTELIWFVKNAGNDCWRQRRSVVEQQCYSQTAILTALGAVGFVEIESIAAPDAGVTAELGFGRMFFSGRTPRVR